MTTKRHTAFSNLTVGLAEAAEFLGFSSKARFREKVKSGEIPLGIKPGREWVFLKEDLIEYLRENQHNRTTIIQTALTRPKICQSANRRTVRIITQDSASRASEYKNRLDALLKRKRNDMKINENRNSENSSSSESPAKNPGTKLPSVG